MRLWSSNKLLLEEVQGTSTRWNRITSSFSQSYIRIQFQIHHHGLCWCESEIFDCDFLVDIRNRICDFLGVQS